MALIRGSQISGSVASASYAVTASYALNAGDIFPFSGSAVITGSLLVTGGITGSMNITNLSSGSYTQSFTNQSTWTVQHNLNSAYVVVQTYDSNEEQMLPQTIDLTDANTTTITFPIALSGTAVVMVGTPLAGGGGGGNTSVSASYALTASYIDESLYKPGLYNQTGSSIPVIGSVGINSSGSLIGGGVGILTVPANGFKKGNAYHACLTGEITATNNHTLEIRISSNGVTLADTGTITLSGTTNQNWRMDIDFSINEIGGAGTAIITTAGLFRYTKDAGNELLGEMFSFTNNTTFDTTISNALVVEAIWGTSSTNTDSIYSQVFLLKRVYW